MMRAEAWQWLSQIWPSASRNTMSPSLIAMHLAERTSKTSRPKLLKRNNCSLRQSKKIKRSTTSITSRLQSFRSQILKILLTCCRWMRRLTWRQSSTKNCAILFHLLFVCFRTSSRMSFSRSYSKSSPRWAKRMSKWWAFWSSLDCQRFYTL